MGFLFIILAGFGWAKPVQFDPAQLKKLRRDKALIAAAGPLSNLVLGIIFIFIVKAMIFHISSYNTFIENLFYIIFQAAAINFGLFIFNLIPIPPLDGSHIVFSGFNIKPEVEYNIRKIGMPVLFLILIIQRYANITIIPIGKMVTAMIYFFI